MSDTKENYQNKRFGRYLILDHLVDGGMAKIYRARFLGEKADKIVAIKMVQPIYSKDKNFQEMFDNELKLAFALHHPNICQTYDYGQYKGIWYTAMEYIDGKNIKQILDRLKKRNEAFPLHLVTYIVSQVCQGLYYAHTFTEKLSGEHYKIIHRDISPHNVMITYDGAVKVIDFGIAKTEMGNESTQAGTIKGKLSYLAPEYIEGVELDQRYDMFAVGITLWEMLCGKKLFSGTNDLNVINQIRECQIPLPSSINPTVPKELDHIVLKALNRDRDLRYRDMNAFSRALLRFLYTHYPDFNPLDLADFTRDIFSEEIKRDREKLLEFGKMDLQQYISDLNSEKRVDHSSVVTNTAIDSATVERLIIEKPKELELDGAHGVDVPKPLPGKANNLQAPPHAPPPLKMVGLSPYKNKSNNQNSAEYNFSKVKRLGYKNQGAKEEGQIFKFAKVALAVALVSVVVSYSLKKSGYDISQLWKGETNSRSLSGKAELEDSEVAQGVIYLENYDLSMTVKINGDEVIYSPLGVKVPLNKELSVVVEKAGAAHFERRLTLTNVRSGQSIRIPNLKVAAEGFLTVIRKYKKGSTLVYFYDGRKIEVSLPVRNYRMPAGDHRVIILNPEKQTIDRFKLKIEENKNHSLENL